MDLSEKSYVSIVLRESIISLRDLNESGTNRGSKNK